MTNSDFDFDCIVVGGGAAGLSAALVLGRARRRTLVVDAGRQSNLAAEGIGGLLGHDGRPPAEFYALGRRELTKYPSVHVHDGEVVGGSGAVDGFVLTLLDGSELTTRRVLLAAGMEYRYPALPGLEPLWGHSVFHCPFCHGWEVRDRPLGILGGDTASAVHRAQLLRSWSDDVTVFTGGDTPTPEQRDHLLAAGVAVEERPLTGVLADGRELTGVRFTDGDQRPLGGLLVAATLHRRGPLAAQLGAEPAPPTPISEETVKVTPQYATGVPGLFAAGDLAIAMPSVANAVMSGANAAAMIVGTLTGAIPMGAPALHGADARHAD